MSSSSSSTIIHHHQLSFTTINPPWVAHNYSLWIRGVRDSAHERFSLPPLWKLLDDPRLWIACETRVSESTIMNQPSLSNHHLTMNHYISHFSWSFSNHHSPLSTLVIRSRHMYETATRTEGPMRWESSGNHRPDPKFAWERNHSWVGCRWPSKVYSPTIATLLKGK